MTPTNLQEFECMLTRLIDRGDFDQAGDRQEIRWALSEIMNKLAIGQHTFTACERLLGSLFVRALEQTRSIPAAIE